MPLPFDLPILYPEINLKENYSIAFDSEKSRVLYWPCSALGVVHVNAYMMEYNKATKMVMMQ